MNTRSKGEAVFDVASASSHLNLYSFASYRAMALSLREMLKDNYHTLSPNREKQRPSWKE